MPHTSGNRPASPFCAHQHNRCRGHCQARHRLAAQRRNRLSTTRRTPCVQHRETPNRQHRCRLQQFNPRRPFTAHSRASSRHRRAAPQRRAYQRTALSVVSALRQTDKERCQYAAMKRVPVARRRQLSGGQRPINRCAVPRRRGSSHGASLSRARPKRRV